MESRPFRGATIAAIVLSAIIVGLETNGQLYKEYGEAFRIVDGALVSFFVLEIGFRIAAEGKRPLRFFRNPWNLFDFGIVLACLVPLGGAFFGVLRLVRVLRVLRLLTSFPKLQLIVESLLRSIPAIGYVSMLLALLFYVYGVIGVFTFGNNDPAHFGGLGRAFLTLFQVLTLEGWADIMRFQLTGCMDAGASGCESFEPKPIQAVLYFVSFILVGTMVVLNLFIGVIMNGIQQAEAERSKNTSNDSVG